MNQRSRVFFAIFCATVFLIAGCSKPEKNGSASTPSTSDQKAVDAQEAPIGDAPDNQPASAQRIDITAANLREMIANKNDMIILDVRDPEELVSGPAPLENTINIPIPELSSRFNELPRDKDIVVVCLSGQRSAAAGDFLIQQGFAKIYNLLGGLWVYRQEEGQ